MRLAATKLCTASGIYTETVLGLTGYTRECLIAFLAACPVHADRMPRKLGERPAPHPIMVDRVFRQCQVCAGRRGRPGRHVCAACRRSSQLGCLPVSCHPSGTHAPSPRTAPSPPAAD